MHFYFKKYIFIVKYGLLIIDSKYNSNFKIYAYVLFNRLPLLGD